MNTRFKYYILITLLICLQAAGLKAQTAPWVYPGGLAGNDEVTDLVFPAPYDFIYACIKGGESDSISFTAVCLDRAGNLVWETELNKDVNLEVPNSIAFDTLNQLVRIVGYAQTNATIWAVELEAETGEVYQYSGGWADASEDSSGITIYTAPGDTTNMMMFSYSSGKLICMDSWDLPLAPIISSYNFPDPMNNRALIIRDCESYYDLGAVITGTYGPTMQPYVWILHDLDSVYYDEPDIDSVIMNGVNTVGDTGIALVGNLWDSSAIFFTRYIDGGIPFDLIPALDTLYPSPGYPVTGEDVFLNADYTFSILTIHYDPSGTRTVLMTIDLDGDIISEITLFPEEQTTRLHHITSAFDFNMPLIFGGTVETDSLDKLNEYLIASSDTIPIMPGCIYNCVWPGDANNNGVVDMTDLFPIGAFYEYSGAQRDSISIYWIGDVADEWVYSYGDLNAKYANCDGDSDIIETDTLAIVENYSDTHAIFTLKNNGGDIPIWLNTTGIILEPGYNEIPIMLGTEDISVDDIYGLEFSISYEGLPVIDSTTLRIKFYDSWIGNAAEMLQLDTAFASIHLIDAGLVNTLHANHSGYGEIGKLSFVVEDNIAGIMIASGDSTIIFNITGPTGVLNDLSEVSISGSACEVLVSTEVLNDFPENKLMLFPNPWHGEILHVCPENMIKNNFSYELNAIDGSLVEAGAMYSNLIELNNTISAGEYILKIIGEDHVYQFKLIHL